MKIFLFAIVGLLVLLAVAAGFLVTTCESDDYCRGLVYLVDKLTDYRLELDHSCTVNLSSTPEFSAATLKIIRPGRPGSFVFRRVRVKLLPAAFLHGHLQAEVAVLVDERETLKWLLPRELYALNSIEFSGLVTAGTSMLKLQKVRARGRSPRGAVLDLAGGGRIDDFSAPQPFSRLDFFIKVASPVSGDFAGYLPDFLPELGPVHGSLRLVDLSPQDLAVRDIKLDFAASGSMQLHVEGGIAKIPVDPEVVNSGIDLDITLKAPRTAPLAVFAGRSVPELGPVIISGSLRGSKKSLQIENLDLATGVPDRLQCRLSGRVELGDLTVEPGVPVRNIDLAGSAAAPAGGELLPVEAEKNWKVPPSGPLAATFQLHGDGDAVKLAEFSGSFGRSRLSADLVFFPAGKPPRLNGLVTVQTVYLDELFPRLASLPAAGSPEKMDGPLPGGERGGQTDEKSSSPPVVFFSRKPLPLAWLRQRFCDVDVDISVARLLNADQEVLHSLDMAVKIEDSVFSLDPVSFGYEGGYVKASLLIDGGTVPQLSFIGAADDLDLVQALRCLGLSSPLTGKVTIDADLHSCGGSEHELAANLEGHLGVVLENGRIPTHILSLVAVDMLGWSFQRTVMKNQSVDLSCVVLGIQANQGMLQCKALLDAPNMLVNGTGSIDLGKETCDLVLKPKKKRKFWALVTPVTIKGSLRNPDIRAIPMTSTAILTGGALLMPQFLLPAIGLNYLWEMISKDKNGVKSPCFERLR